jgi:hypothetical protein
MLLAIAKRAFGNRQRTVAIAKLSFGDRQKRD